MTADTISLTRKVYENRQYAKVNNNWYCHDIKKGFIKVRGHEVKLDPRIPFFVYLNTDRHVILCDALTGYEVLSEMHGGAIETHYLVDKMVYHLRKGYKDYAITTLEAIKLTGVSPRYEEIKRFYEEY